MNNTRPQRRLDPLIVYAAALITALLWPFLLPGFLGLRDMVILDHPALTEAAFGLGDTPARNAPQDGVLAIVGTIIPAGIFVRVLLVFSATLGAYLSTLWVQHPRHDHWHKAAAITLTLWNPFVIERLLQGHWSLVIAAWLLPGIAVVSTTRSKAALVALCSITPTGLVLGLITALWSSYPLKKQAGKLLGIGALLALPWVIPSLLAPPLSFGTSAFVARAEAHAGTIGALLGLGGIWNANAVPPSRDAGFAIAGVILLSLLIWWFPKKEGALALCALACCLFMTFGPVEWVSENIPGAALFRDSQKVVILMLPAMVAAAARITTSRFQRDNSFWKALQKRPILPVLVIVLAILQIPDAPYAMREVRPYQGEIPWTQLEGTTLNADSSGIVVFNGTSMVDPWTKATDIVAGGELTVDGQLIDPASTAYSTALDRWRMGDLKALEDSGINGVISDGRYHQISTPANTKPTAQWWLGFTLTLTWLLTCAFLCALALWSRTQATAR